MFAALVTDLRKDLEGVKKVVLWQEALRDLIHPPTAGINQSLNLTPADVAQLRAQAPAKLDWQIFDHSAAISRIYGIYELGLITLLSRYLDLMPRVYPNYGLLSETMRSQYRIGIGQILLKWSSEGGKYSHLPEGSISSGLSDGLRGNAYSLLRDAFLVDPENYRSNALIRLFNGVGFKNCFAWISKDKKLIEFCAISLSGTNTPEGFLDELVKTRNEAAHGAPGSLASTTIVTNYAEFIALTIESLASLLRSHLIREGISNGCAIEVAEVLHVFSDNIIGVSGSGAQTISVGEHLYAGKRCIDPVSICSLRITNTPHTSVSLTKGTECGIQLDSPVAKGARLYRWCL